MPDKLSRERRSANMRAIQGKDTAPEMFVRRMVHGMGYRYRLHGLDLPGSPDLVFRSRRKVIFVHGCFWHQHKGCSRANEPKSNIDFWRAKLDRNAARDAEQLKFLRKIGWRVLVVWQCELKNERRLAAKLRSFLGGKVYMSRKKQPEPDDKEQFARFIEAAGQIKYDNANEAFEAALGKIIKKKKDSKSPNPSSTQDT